MLESDLRAGLRSLQNSLDKMRSLLAWDQLRQSEMRDTQSIVTAIADPTEGDLRNEYSSFLFTLAQVRNLLRSGAAVLPPRIPDASESNFFQQLTWLTDILPNCVCRGLARWRNRPTPSWVAWVIVMLLGCAVRQILISMIVTRTLPVQ